MHIKEIIFFSLFLTIILCDTKDIDIGTFEPSIPNYIYPLKLDKGDQVRATLTANSSYPMTIKLTKGNVTSFNQSKSAPFTLEKVALYAGLYNLRVQTQSKVPIPYQLQIRVNETLIGIYNQSAVSYNYKKPIYLYNVTKTCRKVKFISPDYQKIGAFHWFSPSAIAKMKDIDTDYTYSYQTSSELIVSFFQTGTWYLIPQLPQSTTKAAVQELKYPVRFYIKCVVCGEDHSKDDIEQCDPTYLIDNKKQQKQEGMGIGMEIEIFLLIVILVAVMIVFLVSKIRKRRIGMIRENMIQNHVDESRVGDKKQANEQLADVAPSAQQNISGSK